MLKRFLSKTVALSAAVLSCTFQLTFAEPSFATVQRVDNGALAQKLGIPLYEWQDDHNPNPKLIFVAIHGFTQQGGCFDVLARSLAARGYLVVAPDLRGHGRWIGHTGSTNSDFMVSCDDESRLLAQLRKGHPGAKIFGMGESAGCAVLLRAVTNEPKNVKGIILCAAGVEPHMHKPGGMGPKFMLGMAKLVAPVDLTDYYTKYVSDDKRIADEMVHDPLNKSHQSALSLIGTMNFISQMPALANQLPKSIPALLIQGSNDQIVNPLSASRVYDALKTPDKTLEEISGSGHILLGTAFIKPIVLNGTFDWLAKHGGMPLNTAITASSDIGHRQASYHAPATQSTASMFSNVDPISTAGGANSFAGNAMNGATNASTPAGPYDGANKFDANGATNNASSSGAGYGGGNPTGTSATSANAAPIAPFSQKFKHKFHL